MRERVFLPFSQRHGSFSRTFVVEQRRVFAAFGTVAKLFFLPFAADAELPLLPFRRLRGWRRPPFWRRRRWRQSQQLREPHLPRSSPNSPAALTVLLLFQRELLLHPQLFSIDLFLPCYLT